MTAVKPINFPNLDQDQGLPQSELQANKNFDY
jgi:hypothetical protein